MLENLKISKREAMELLISTIIISFCFTWVQEVSGIYFLIVYVTMFFIIGLAFILHELAHKYTAIRFGLEAEFRAWYLGLAIALLLAITVKFFFIAPGAVQIYAIRFIRKHEEGIISVAGVLVNIVLAFIFFILYIIFGNEIFRFGTYINSWLAFINLLPLPPLDGSKIIFWNPLIWIILLVVSLALYLNIRF